MISEQEVIDRLAFLGDDLTHLILEKSVIREFPAGTEILRQGQYVAVVPIVLKGLLKVFTRHEDKELLLYYIRPLESCVMSFSSGINNESSRIAAVTEDDTIVLLLPVDLINRLINNYPKFNMLFHKQYEIRYQELLDTVNQLIFTNVEQRLLVYLEEKVKVTGKSGIRLSHREIAGELGTAREVISRTIKRLENSGVISQSGDGVISLLR